MKTLEMKQLLLPTDFSEVSINALRTALSICERHHANLTLIHVIENTYMLTPFETSGATILASLVKSANEKLSDLAKEIRSKYTFVVDYIVQAGNPADEICSWALHKGIDLIVIGAHGTSGFRASFLGSNAYRVIKNSPSTVLSIPDSQSWIEFSKVLFPIRMATNVLEKYNAVRHIIKKDNSVLKIVSLGKMNDPGMSVDIQSITETMRKRMVSDGIKCTSQVYYCENVASQVLEIAESEQTDLIVITSAIHVSLKDFFLEADPQEIVNKARVPVLSVRPRVTEKTLKQNYNELLSAQINS